MGHELVDLLAGYLSTAREGLPLPVLPKREPEEMLRKYSGMLERPGGFSVREFFGEVVDDSNHIHHPGYVGHQVCAPVPLGAVAGLAANLLNNGSAVFEMGPANTAMERSVLLLTARAMGFPAGADGVLTSGGSLGNLTALLAARSAKSLPEDARPIAFLVSEASHYSNPKSLRIMGLEDRSIVRSLLTMAPGSTRRRSLRHWRWQPAKAFGRSGWLPTPAPPEPEPMMICRPSPSFAGKGTCGFTSMGRTVWHRCSRNATGTACEG